MPKWQPHDKIGILVAERGAFAPESLGLQLQSLPSSHPVDQNGTDCPGQTMKDASSFLSTSGAVISSVAWSPGDDFLDAYEYTIERLFSLPRIPLALRAREVMVA